MKAFSISILALNFFFFLEYLNAIKLSESQVGACKNKVVIRSRKNTQYSLGLGLNYNNNYNGDVGKYIEINKKKEIFCVDFKDAIIQRFNQNYYLHLGARPPGAVFSVFKKIVPPQTIIPTGHKITYLGTSNGKKYYSIINTSKVYLRALAYSETEETHYELKPYDALDIHQHWFFY